THVMMVDKTESPSKGQEVASAVTVIEIPPMVVYGVRCYDDMRSLCDVFTTDEKVLKGAGVKGKKTPKEPNAEEVQDVRLLVYSQPAKTCTGKKHVEQMEIALGGADSAAKLEYAKGMLGKELKISDVFKPGEKVDIVAVTRGKGWQGPVRRFGVNCQRRKATGKRRHVGTLGPFKPAYVQYTAPQAGQTGYHTRTELNKEILKIGDKVEEINPPAGFPNYGFVKNDYVVVKGSIPGPAKRLVKLRLAYRGKAGEEPQVMHISLDPK
ncbi:TPA: 50S ribosomal protein L3, partial [Candidatus Micrarchaeota archaeon]|nr:50S ribosomal protein L3 [Candidatus Micrarchaeota archaeon]